jgi:hypothetical protein
MEPAALGLTCRDAMLIFSQNETLRLQRENAELKARLAVHEPTPRIFKTQKEYFKVEKEAMNFLFDWIRNNTRAGDSFGLFLGNGCGEFMPHPDFCQTIEHAIHMITGNRDLSYHMSGECLGIVDDALRAAWYLDNRTSDAPGMWCRDQRLVADIICRSLIPDKIPELISHAVEYPLDSEYCDVEIIEVGDLVE